MQNTVANTDSDQPHKTRLLPYITTNRSNG